MSWEGYGQALCKNGHAYSVGAYTEREGCPICGAERAWINWVDETNGCYCNELKGGQKCSAHEIELEVDKPATYKECPACHHKGLLTPATYKIPKREQEIV